MCIHIYIYIYIYREREIHTCIMMIVMIIMKTNHHGNDYDCYYDNTNDSDINDNTMRRGG